MRISDFSIGDIIRVVADEYASIKDRSYMGKPYKLLGLEKGVIFLEPLTKDIINRKVLDLPEEAWAEMKFSRYPKNPTDLQKAFHDYICGKATYSEFKKALKRSMKK